ncbi:hypothetical protein OH687_26850 [Burkholderia anthina]|nr:hypothetical protein OH687_26850 [Burkholderia anthina]
MNLHSNELAWGFPDDGAPDTGVATEGRRPSKARAARAGDFAGG